MGLFVNNHMPYVDIGYVLVRMWKVEGVIFCIVISNGCCCLYDVDCYHEPHATIRREETRRLIHSFIRWHMALSIDCPHYRIGAGHAHSIWMNPGQLSFDGVMNTVSANRCLAPPFLCSGVAWKRMATVVSEQLYSRAASWRYTNVKGKLGLKNLEAHYSFLFVVVGLSNEVYVQYTYSIL